MRLFAQPPVPGLSPCQQYAYGRPGTRALTLGAVGANGTNRLAIPVKPNDHVATAGHPGTSLDPAAIAPVRSLRQAKRMPRQSATTDDGGTSSIRQNNGESGDTGGFGGTGP